ncbi:MAG TPA: hypothetical protein PLG50_00025 [bacterium]|nr:hypothetical protein [bacterium]HQG44025.1 hypothetical protein [bacterium]HQI49095.1 hypothetical protein [bacterium]HQJ65682.1 hypothetical protein [bacterium]
MKQTFLLVAGLLLLLTAGLSLAQTKTTYTVGAGMWMPAYSWVYTGNESGMDDYELGNGSYFGPYLAVNSGRWNFGASMLIGTLKADDQEYAWQGLEAKRTDLNFTLGYRLISTTSLSGNAFIGLKYLKEDQTADSWYWTGYSVDTGDYIDWYDKYDATVSGAMYGAGVSLVVPFGGSNLYAYGSMAYLLGTLKTENNLKSTDVNPNGYSSWDTEDDTHLFALTLGMGYRFPSGFGLNLGYRGDLYGNEASDEFEYAQRLAGLVLNASYTF